MTNPLVAARQDSTTWHTGLNLIDDGVGLYEAVRSGSWVEAGLGVVGGGLDLLTMAMNPVSTLVSYGLNFLIEHVQPLQDVLNKLAGDADQIAAYSATWHNVGRAVGQAGTDFTTAVGRDTANWTGPAADAYRTHAGAKAGALSTAATCAHTLGAAVTIVGAITAAVRAMVRDLVTQAIGQFVQVALEEIFSLGLATPFVAAQVSEQVAAWSARIGGVIKKLVSSASKLRPLMTKLDDIWKAIQKALSTLHGKGGKAPHEGGGGGGPHGGDTPPSTPKPGDPPPSTPKPPEAPKPAEPTTGGETPKGGEPVDGTTTTSGTTPPEGTTNTSGSSGSGEGGTTKPSESGSGSGGETPPSGNGEGGGGKPPEEPKQPAGGAGEPRRTQPSGQPNPEAKPGGKRTQIGKKNDEATKRSLQRENDSADLLAQKGYDVEQNPKVPGDKNPDYKIEGEVFDNYAPSTGRVENIADVIEGKVSSGQADRIVLNTSDSPVDLGALRQHLTDSPITGLKEVIVIDKAGNVVHFYP
ncbi:hypothetical protein [Actinosynnema sp. NPDC020468]|uniref:CdiA C-terminal domain-containing protein n=1 Tax=Actinosynnema sp. NPDC020468 TaxID=3154488 RepID=UPI0033E439FC